MSFKKAINDIFSKKEKIVEIRLNSSKNFFILTSLVFFLNYFFVWARFFDNIFLKTLSYTYVLFIVWMLFYFYFFFLNKFEKLKIVLVFVWIILFGIFLIPII